MSSPDDKRTSYQTVNPSTNNVEKNYELMNDSEVNEILERAHMVYKEWRKTPFTEKSDLMRRLATLLKERKDELARLCSIEMGKLHKEGVEEVELCASICEYYADNAEKFLSDTEIDVAQGRAIVSYEPMGVILSIQPWNFPFYQIIRSAAPHIMAGNTFLLKHSHNVPQCAEAMERLFLEAGFPVGVYTNLFISEEKVADVIESKEVRGVTFTGSERAGASIASKAGKALKKIVLELGGSDPLIVLDDADLDVAVKMAVEERLSNCGQVCSSPKRIIVMNDVVDQFLDKAKIMFEELNIGNPLDNDTDLGPLVNTAALDKVLKQVEDTVKEGATLVYGGEKLDSPGAFMKPAILTGIRPGTVAYQEEIFGPVLCVYPVSGEQEAIDLANDSNYGLGGTILTKDEERGVQVARHIQSGMVYINHVTTTAPELPFGGVKNSGYGRELSKLGILEFVSPKLIRVSSPEAPY